MEPTTSAHLGHVFVNSRKEGTDQNVVGSLVEVKAPRRRSMLRPGSGKSSGRSWAGKEQGMSDPGVWRDGVVCPPSLPGSITGE